MPETKMICIVMDGNYEPSVDSVFTDKDAAKRRAAALREGYYYSMDADALMADDYLYQVDYTAADDWVCASLEDGDGADGVERDEDGYCRTYVRAKTHHEAEKLGKAKILGYLGIDVEEEA